MRFYKEDLIKDAKDYFGTTDTIDYAGYINIDGTLLDFAGPEGHYMHRRNLDHRDIDNIYNDDVDLSSFPDWHSPYGQPDAPMLHYMSLGNIRIVPERNSLEFSSDVEPTKIQYNVIRKILNYWKDFADIDFTDTKRGSPVGILSYEENTYNPDKIIDDIKYWYKYKEVPYKSNLHKFL